MINLPNTVFHYCAERTGILSSSSYSRTFSVWSQEESRLAYDGTLDLLEELQRDLYITDIGYKKKLIDLRSKYHQKCPNRPDITGTVNIKICMDTLAEFDAFYQPYTVHKLADYALTHLCRKIEEGYTVGIDCRKVFLVSDLGVQPPGFRLGIDRCVTTSEAYKKATEQFSYQFANIVFEEFNPACTSPKTRPWNQILKSSIIFKNSIHTYKNPLKNFHYFNSPMAAWLHFNLYVRRPKAPIMAFTSEVEAADLLPIFQSYQLTEHHELILLFNGSDYDDPVKRQQVFEGILHVIQQSKCSFLVHVYLITKGNLETNLVSLTPTSTDQSQPFQPLSQDVGYYLSSNTIYSPIYRAVQAKSTYKQWMETLEVVDPNALESIPKSTPTKSPGAYILADTVNDQVRKAKNLSTEQLKNKIRLNVTYQLEHDHKQAIQEEIQVKQTLQVTQEVARLANTSENSALYWFGALDLEGYSDKLRAYAQEKIAKPATIQIVLEQAGFFTQFYLQHHNPIKFYKQLANDKAFRLKIAARVFGVALMEYNSEHDTFQAIKIPHYSVNYIDILGMEGLPFYRGSMQDGFAAKNRVILNTPIQGSILMDISERCFSHPETIIPPLIFSEIYSLSKLQDDKSVASRIQGPLHYSVLLSTNDLASAQPDLQHGLIQVAVRLIELFNPHPSLSQAEIQALEDQFIGLIRFYFPDREPDIARLEAFMARFAVHNEDNIKLLVQILIIHHKMGFELLFDLLSYLEKRALLENFYIIYFQCALNVSAVEQLFQNRPLLSEFLQLAARTPIVDSAEQWPDFEKFAHHYLVYLAKHNLSKDFFFIRIEALWKNLFAKLLAYCGEQQTAERQLKKFVQQITRDQGLSIGPVAAIETFLEGLRTLLDHAVTKHTLEEQISEIAGVSLLPMDAPYACEQNGFLVICQEMQIHSSAINPLYGSYAVSHEDLVQAIAHHKPDDPALKIAVFRYLGTQTLRAPIAFYRTLYQKCTQVSDADAVYLAELVCAYFVTNQTEDNYQDELNESLFSRECIAFLLEHGLDKKITKTCLSNELARFFTELRKIPIVVDEDNKKSTLWSLWREQGVRPLPLNKKTIPPILLRPFAAHQLQNFLLIQKKNLLKALPVLSNDPSLAMTIIDSWSSNLHIKPEHHKLIHHFILAQYPRFDMEVLLDNATRIASFLNSLATLLHINPHGVIYLALEQLEDPKGNLDSFLCLLKLLAQTMTKHHGATQESIASSFIFKLAKHPDLYLALPQAKSLARILLKSLFTNNTQNNLELHLKHIQTLLPYEQEEAQNALTTLIQVANTTHGAALLNTHSRLSASELMELTKLLQAVEPLCLALETIEWLFSQDHPTDWTLLNNLLLSIPSENRMYLLRIALVYATQNKVNLVEALTTLKAKPITGLTKIVQLQQVHTITPQQLLELVNHPTLDAAVATFLQQVYQNNLERYAIDTKTIRAQIAQIRLKANDTEDDLPLSPKEQAAIWSDYQEAMSYMMDNPISIETPGITKSLTINQMSESDFQHVFKTLQVKYAARINTHHDHLLLVALCAEALYRTTNKFPRSTQLLTLLQGGHHRGNLIHELQTGEGKSIIAAMHAAVLCNMGRTVDLSTENNELAQTALDKFTPFYRYLGIPLSNTILTAQSAHAEYIANGVNYSTASNLALFRARMALEKKTLPKNPALISDEVDATLTSTVQFRLATTLNVLFNNTEHWETVYQYLMEFVQDETLYLNNPCSEQEDILNLKNYIILRKPSTELLKFTDTIPDEILGALLDSAMVATSLEEDVDYHVVEITDKESTFSYAAPIIASTNRPDPTVSYSDCVQQLLHTVLNNKTPSPTHSFKIEPNTETIIAISAKNFFDYYRLHNGPIIGFTGTAGSQNERNEFYNQQGLVAYSYPTFYPDRGEDLGSIYAFGTADLHNKIRVWIREYKQQAPTQPILLITESPQVTEQLRTVLYTPSKYTLQFYHGYAQTGQSEAAIVAKAGQENVLTLANQSLARGIDIEPEHDDGLVLVNTCRDITPSQLRQIQGRTARNGKPGKRISIIDGRNIGLPTDSLVGMAQAVNRHQHQVSQKQQKSRMSMRLLEETRYLLIHGLLLPLREKADYLLARQFGKGSSLVEHTELVRSLNILNLHAEKHYATLLAENGEITEEVSAIFLAARVNDYQGIINQWFAKYSSMSMEFVEPSIPLHTLKDIALSGLTVKQLICFAAIFHQAWELIGNQQVMNLSNSIDRLVLEFTPYFSQTDTFKNTLLNALETEGLFDPKDIDQGIAQCNAAIHTILQEAQSIPVVGYLLPTEVIKAFFRDYFTTVSTQIKNKQWEAISPPSIDTSAINSWLSSISRIHGAVTIGLGVIGGPIPYILKQWIVPAVFKSLKAYLSKQFASSTSLLPQLLINIDKLSKELPESINALLELMKGNVMTVGSLLDSVGNLAKNKALLMVLTYSAKLSNRTELLPIIESIPEIVACLEPYRDRELRSLLSNDFCMELLRTASQSATILKALENSPFKSSLLHIAELSPQSIAKLRVLPFKDMLNLLKNLAHPNFYAFLTQLPDDTTYDQLCLWIDTPPTNLPPKTQQALNALLDYQTNHERIANENKLALQQLQITHGLSVQKMEQWFDSLKPKVIEPLTPSTKLEVELTYQYYAWLSQALQLMALATLTACMVYSALYLSAAMAVAFCIPTVWVAYDVIGELLTPSTPCDTASLKPTASEYGFFSKSKSVDAEVISSCRVGKA